MANNKVSYVELKDNWGDGIINGMHAIVEKASQGIFDTVQASLQNGITYTVIMVSAMVWLLLRLKNGYPTRDEMYSAGKWVMLVLFVYAVFYSYNGYKGFISLFMLPANWVQSAIINGMAIELPKSAAGSTSNFFAVIGSHITNVYKLKALLMQHGLQEIKGGWFSWASPEFLKILYVMWKIFDFGQIYHLIFMIFVIGIIIMVTVSQFICAILITAAPIMIPLIVFKNLRVYFYSWLKLFISYSLYAPIALIIYSIATSPFNDIAKYSKNSQLIKSIYDNPGTFTFSLSMTTLICIYLLSKIPNWVSQIMGMQGLDSAGAGAGHAIQKFTAKAPIMAAGGAVSGGVGAAAGAVGKGAGLAGAAKGFAGGAAKGAGRGFASGVPGGQTIRTAYRSWRMAKAMRDSVKDAEAKP